MSATEQPIERVNYFNGQRLEAADFRADQDYHMRVLRKILSALYSPGVIQGFEVTAHPTDKHKVVVAPGVGVDYWGRELILLQATDVQAAGTPSTTPGVIFGNYLVASYAEQRVQVDSDGCAVSGSATGACAGNLSWGAPTRIEATPKLEFSDTWPTPTSGKVVLAQVALQAGCQVGTIETGVRQYAVPAQQPTVQPLSLEGEKDIDAANPKNLYFHVEGNVPNTVTLYLRGALFSTLFYTELGQHSHDSSFNPTSITLLDHTHGFSAITTGTGTQDTTKPATLQAWTWDDTVDVAIRMWGSNDGGRRSENLTSLNPVGDGTLVQLLNLNEHTHDIPAGTTSPGGGQVIPMPALALKSAGVGPPNARTGTGQNPRTYVNGMMILYDGEDITAQVLAQLTGVNPASWPAGSTLGDGTAAHVLVTAGTGPISLLQLGLDFTPGQHYLTFQVPSGGGQIQYNLYVD
jgi:hypothetical protein